MQNALGNIGDTAAMPRHQGRVPRIFQEYRNHFGLLWRVMLPVIVVSLVFNSTFFLVAKLANPEALWRLSTSGNITAFGQLSATPIGVHSSVGFHGAAFGIGFLWLAMCPLSLIIIYQHREKNVTFGEVWRLTRRKALSILAAWPLMLLVMGAPVLILIFIAGVLEEFLIQGTLMGPALLPTLIAGAIAVYFLVKWSLYNQCIIIENLSIVAALRRSSELVRGRWGQLFGMYLLLTLGTMVFTTAVFGLTLLFFSVVASEFAPLREVLQSGKFFGLFVGGQVQITLPDAPVWGIGVMVTLNTLINAVLAPIWAIVTTHLYMERAGTPEQAVSV